MQFFALACSSTHLAELFLGREDAEWALAAVLSDEPELEDELDVVQIDFSGDETLVRYLPRRTRRTQ